MSGLALCVGAGMVAAFAVGWILGVLWREDDDAFEAGRLQGRADTLADLDWHAVTPHPRVTVFDQDRAGRTDPT